MATLPVQRILQVTEYSQHHGTLGTEAPTQDFKRGNLISRNAASGLLEATAAGAPAAAAKVMLACQDSENVATPRKNNLAKVDPTDSMVFEVTALGVGSAALLAAGKEYGYSIDPTTKFGVLNLADTTNKVFRIVAHDGDVLAGASSLTDTNARVYARLMAAVIN